MMLNKGNVLLIKVWGKAVWKGHCIDFTHTNLFTYLWLRPKLSRLVSKSVVSLKTVSEDMRPDGQHTLFYILHTGCLFLYSF